ncbi:MAG: hypothetical protein KF713_01080 [Turneriella sp.]|nr:hypothetical protein [Turneriella sp.]
MNLPFHATESEKRIIRELTQTANLRENGQALTAIDGASTAAIYIAQLRARLFPAETRLAAERTRLLKPLQTDFMRTSFDQTLETATLGINAKIRTAEEFRSFAEKIGSFDFEAWSRHCDNERADAD